MANALCPQMTPHWHLGVFECSPTEDLYLRNSIYRNKQTFNTPEVKLERKSDKARPLGMAMCECDEPTPRTRTKSHTIETFEPACIKDRMLFNPCDKGYTRFSAGEHQGMYKGWAEKFEDDVADGQMDMDMARKRREEFWMAQILVHAAYKMTGDMDGGETDEVWHDKDITFERDENHTIILEGKDIIDPKTTSVKGLGLLFAWVSNMIARKCGTPATKLLLGTAAAAKIMCLDDWDKYICCRAGSSGVIYPLEANVGAANGLQINGVRRLGDIWKLGLEVCVYDGWYDGCMTKGGKRITEPTPYIPPGGAVFIADGGEDNMGFGGAVHYGAIRDIDAIGLGTTGQGDLERFVKSEDKFVPSCRDVYYASKPLVMAYDINGSAYVQLCPDVDEDTEGFSMKQISAMMASANASEKKKAA